MSDDITLLSKAGKQVPFERAVVTEVAANGVWGEMPLINLIRNRLFSVIVIRDLHYHQSTPAVRAITEDYRRTKKYGSSTV